MADSFSKMKSIPPALRPALQRLFGTNAGATLKNRHPFPQENPESFSVKG